VNDIATAGGRMTTTVPVALITGASRGLGRAVAAALAGRSWHLVVDARRPEPLRRARDDWRTGGEINLTGGETHLITGDVADPAHRTELVETVNRLGRLDLLMNNASVLGPSPQPTLASYPLPDLAEVYRVNVLAPLALAQPLLPVLARSGGRLINVSSDAAVEPYPGWGGYGSAKAALDQLSAVLAAEHPELRVYAFDPGDMRTDLHQQAFPGMDISDRPEPETVVPAVLRLLGGDLPSGRYRAADLLAAGLPAAGLPAADLLAADLPAAGLLAAELPAAGLPAAELPAAELPAAELPAAEGAGR
jgi:NAD(P)-dependent dehydrogenase (short-subunit alcohol dehydrogenase family)